MESIRALKEAPIEDLPELARSVRRRIIDVVARKGGHLGANLGTVELAIALHYVYDIPDDVLVWDVGHQAYAHKLITGRWDEFETNREYGGISGFPKRDESPYDLFGAGHSSTSISAVMGMGLADRLKGIQGRDYLAVIGDASLGGGMALEALNHLAESQLPVVVIYNDNAIGIDPGIGALQDFLDRSEDRAELIRALGLEYRGPIDGHNIEALVGEFRLLRGAGHPVFLHLRTVKGKGLAEAERSPVVYHAPGKFEPESGRRILDPDQSPKPYKFQDVFGHTLVRMVEQGCELMGITAAMPTGTSMKILQERYPNRVVDVGIAEQHAVTLAAGMAARGAVPFCAIYSTFFQRAYDQLIHDVAIQGLKVIFCLDRAGLVGQDGPTHHGVFDIASMLPVPGLTLCAPLDESQLAALMVTAYRKATGPVAIRYPRGRGYLQDYEPGLSETEWGTSRILQEGKRAAIISYGTVGQAVNEFLESADAKDEFGWVDLRFAKPLDRDTLDRVFRKYGTVFCIEEGAEIGGVGSEIIRYANRNHPGVVVHSKGIPDEFIPHGPAGLLRSLCGLDAEGLKAWILPLLG